MTAAFKKYDIRGLYPDEINEELAYDVGRAIVELFGAANVVVGYDMRDSSPMLSANLEKGITQAGADVISIGMCPTPLVGFSVAHYGYSMGVMVSASHNPSEYNAFKVIGKGGIQLHAGSGLTAIRDYVSKNEFKKKQPKGSVIKKEVLGDYTKHIMSKTKNIQGLTVVLDYGNGVASITAQEALKSLYIDAIELYAEPDGRFPNHAANPHDLENFADLQREVINNVADIGIFFDGDGDRSIIVDANGVIINPDLLLALLAVDELSRNPDEKVYYDLRFSKIVEEVVKKKGGKPHMMQVGNPFYKEKLYNEGGIIAGEFSGHIMYKENYCLDDGLFAALKVMEIMTRKKKGIAELVSPFRKYASSEEINLKVKDADAALNKVRKSFSDGISTELDGVYIEFSGWWFSLRKSNTEPLVRLRMEADNEEILEKKKKLILDVLNS